MITAASSLHWLMLERRACIVKGCAPAPAPGSLSEAPLLPFRQYADSVAGLARRGPNIIAEKRKEKKAGSPPTHLQKLSLHMPGAACICADVLSGTCPGPPASVVVFLLAAEC